MTEDQKLPESAVPKSPAEVDLKLKELIRGLADEEKPKAIRILKRLAREARS